MLCIFCRSKLFVRKQFKMPLYHSFFTCSLCFTFLYLTRCIIDYRFGSIETATTTTTTCHIRSNCLNLITRRKKAAVDIGLLFFLTLLKKGRNEKKINVFLQFALVNHKNIYYYCHHRFKYAAIIYDSLFNIKMRKYTCLSKCFDMNFIW